MAKKHLNHKKFTVIKGGSDRNFSGNKLKKWIMYGIIGMIVLVTLNHGANYFRNYIIAKMLDVQVVKINSIYEGVHGTGFYLREEQVLDSTFRVLKDEVPPLTRVRKGQPLGGGKAPISGLVLYTTDGYESYQPIIDDNLIAVFTRLDEETAQEVSTGNLRAKIVNNYQTDIIVKLPWNSGEAIKDYLFINNTSSIRVRLGSDTYTQILPVNVREIKEHDNSFIIHLFSDQLKDDLVDVRFSEVFFIMDTITGIKLPSSSLVNEQGKIGVYTLARNRVVFREVAVMKEDEGFVWVVGLSNNQEVILNPEIVSPGQWIKF